MFSLPGRCSDRHERVPVCLLKNIMFSGLDTFAITAGFLQLLCRVVAEGTHFISFGQEDLCPFPQKHSDVGIGVPI